MNKLSRIYRPFHLEKSFKSAAPRAKTKNEGETPSKSFRVRISTTDFLNILYNNLFSNIRFIQLLVDNGVICQSSAGMYHLLPMGQRALDKLIKLVDAHMMAIGAQKITLNTLTKQSLWKTVGMLKIVGFF